MRLPLDVTIESVLDHVTQEQIFEYYLQTQIDLNSLYLSPLRKDNSPTCSFLITRRGKLWFKDWSGHFAGDCFDLVQAMYQNCSLREALIHVDRDLRLNLFNSSGLAPSMKKEQKIDYTHKPSAVIQIKFRDYSPKDLYYWNSHGIYAEELNLYRVHVATHVWIGSARVWDYKNDNPIFVYLVNDQIKCYRPLEQDKKKKWLSNCTPDNILGWNQLPATGDLCIITKSLKDVMRLKRMGYAACAPQAEENYFPANKMTELMQRFDEVIIFYDNDEAGMRRALEEAATYHIRAIFIPEAFNGKDISGVTKYYGEEDSVELFETLIMKDLLAHLKLLSMQYETDIAFAKAVRVTIEAETARAKLVEIILSKNPEKVEGYTWISNADTMKKWYKAYLLSQPVSVLEDIIQRLEITEQDNETTGAQD